MLREPWSARCETGMGMGRHSIAYIAAQQGLSTPTAAAAYVGRVGALALALGIGAAVAGGNGIAAADESGTGDAASTSTGQDAATGAAEAPTATDAPTIDNPATEVRSPGLFNPPKTKVGTGADDDAHPASLPGVLASIPQKIAASLTHQATTTTPKKRAKSSTAKPAAPQAVTSKATATTVAADRDVEPQSAAPATTGSAAPAPVHALTAATSSIPAKPKPALANPVVTVVSGVLAALGIAPSAANPDGTPTSPMPIVLGVLQLVRREIDHFTLQLTAPLAAVTTALTNANPAIAPGAPTPGDDVPTAYGDIGKWMLKSDGQIADYGGVLHDGKTLLEPVNVIIVDPTSTSATQAKYKLNGAMFWSGFAAQPIHTGGFEGTIDDITYGQEPNLPLFGYSNNLFLFTNDHGRFFGPDPVETSTGYVWSGAFSTEQFAFVRGLQPGHTYVSSTMARTALATRLVLSGRATYGGMVPLDNAYNTATTTTGDHDGYAVVLILK